MNTKNIGRNDPCPCGSGKKYKQCCQTKQNTVNEAAKNRLLESIPDLLIQARQASNRKEYPIAEELYQRILTINPKHVLSLSNMALLKSEQNQPDLGLTYLEKAIKIEPSSERHYNIARLLINLEKNDLAVWHLKKAISLNPGDYVSYNTLGFLCCESNNFKDGLTYFHKSLELNPDYYMASHNLALYLLKQGKYKESAYYYKQAITLNPLSTKIRQSYLYSLSFDSTVPAEYYLQNAKELEKILTKDIVTYQHIVKNSSQKLNIGFVSGDLRTHVVSYFLEGVLNSITSSSLKLFAYSTHSPKEDKTTERLRNLFDKWLDISTMTSVSAAQAIYNDNIHILIDLGGHTANNGLSTFAYKPAPIQVTWLGYWASTGLSFIDYFMADSIGLTKDKHHYFSEKIYYLPKTRLCFTHPSDDIAPDVNILPALKNGYITFGCLQNLSKVNDESLQRWSQIIKNCPNSKLMFKSPQLKDALTKLELIERLATFGIHEEQLLLEASGSYKEYFHSYHKVDFVLDTFPYPGGTTTCEALWMGVPTLTLVGETVLQRQGYSMLYNAGLDDWVCFDDNEYIKKAIDFAHNVPYLASLRRSLREQVKSSPLMDSARFAKHLEEALTDMWQRHTAAAEL
ncbi:MAG: tetratricopeptide repeat protein [Moraxellaceae bacterium]|nr:tetratricopeptide repeat protein [Moraxellaceae bacterium]